jgi:hypothetical protein
MSSERAASGSSFAFGSRLSFQSRTSLGGDRSNPSGCRGLVRSGFSLLWGRDRPTISQRPVLFPPPRLFGTVEALNQEVASLLAKGAVELVTRSRNPGLQLLVRGPKWQVAPRVGSFASEQIFQGHSILNGDTGVGLENPSSGRFFHFHRSCGCLLPCRHPSLQPSVVGVPVGWKAYLFRFSRSV